MRLDTLIRRCFVIFAILLFVQACSRSLRPQPACNFIQNSFKRRVSWNQHLPVRLYIDETVPVAMRAPIISSIEAWNSTGVHFFDLVGIVKSDAVFEQDEFNVIYWLDRWDFGPHTEQSRTTIYWRGNQIFEADIRINNKDFKFSGDGKPELGEVDLQSLMVHELGHVLGMAHNNVLGSVMADELPTATSKQDGLRRQIGKVDLESIACVYK